MANFESRLAIYRNLLEIVREKPWFGTHPGASYFDTLADLEFDPGSAASNEDLASRVRDHTPHNQLLGLAAVWGVPMAGLFLMTWIATGLYGLRALRAARSLPASVTWRPSRRRWWRCRWPILWTAWAPIFITTLSFGFLGWRWRLGVAPLA